MKTALALSALLLAAASPALAQAANSGDDPLAPAREGKAQCYRPDKARKTCASMGFYSWAPDGAITNKAIVLLPTQVQNTVILMNVTGPVTVRDGAVCGKIRGEDIAAAEFTINGKPAPADAVKELRDQIGQATRQMFGSEVCTLYTPDGGVLKATASINGQANPNMAQTVIWVSPADGYRVAP